MLRFKMGPSCSSIGLSDSPWRINYVLLTVRNNLKHTKPFCNIAVMCGSDEELLGLSGIISSMFREILWSTSTSAGQWVGIWLEWCWGVHASMSTPGPTGTDREELITGKARDNQILRIRKCNNSLTKRRRHWFTINVSVSTKLKKKYTS